MKNIKYFLVLMIFVLVSISACAAVNTDKITSSYTPTQQIDEISTNTINQENNIINIENQNKDKQNLIQNEKENNTPTTTNKEKTLIKSNNIENNNTQEKTANNPIILTPQNFNTYITNGVLNGNIPNGANIDIRGKFDGEQYAFKITKPVNLYSSRGDAFLCFYSTQNLEHSYGTPNRSFQITTEGSGTNITGLYFENTMIVTTEAHDIIFDNLTVYCTNDYGWGLGATSIRNSQNVTIKNSYFNTTENRTWLSTVVFAASKNCLIENCTVTGSGLIGNLVYATTYNVEVTDKYGNSNISIRGNKIIGRDLVSGIATCYSVCAKGDNITVENNYIENRNKYLVMSQYELADNEIYQADGSFGRIIVRNNTFDTGLIGLKFSSSTIINNTFYGNVTLNVINNLINENNVVRDASLNPYKSMNTAQEHDAKITIEAPPTYIYDEKPIINVSIINEKTNSAITSGQLEVYVDGTLYKNITVTSTKTSFTFKNNTIGTHRLRIWYYPPGKTQSNSQKQVNLEATPIKGELTLETNENIHIGDTIPLTVSYTLNKNIPLKTNITYTLPGQQPIIIPAVNNRATIQTTVTTDYIRDILGGREQNIRITATTNDSNVEITGISKKLGVQKAPTTITISPTTVKPSTQTTITATITTPTNLIINKGSIKFTDKNGNTLGTSNVNNNKATVQVTFNTPGTEPITATYDATTHYEATTTTKNIKVEKITTKITLNTISNTQYTDNATITGTLKDTNNQPITDNITITINNIANTIKTNNNGAFTYNYKTTTIGTNNITITYNGNNNYAANSTTSTFKVVAKDTKITITPISNTQYTDNVTITGKFETTSGVALKNSAVAITINGVKYTNKTNNNGIYTYNYKTTTIGTNNITVSYGGNSKYKATNTTTTFKVTPKTTKITINKINNTQYTDTVTITGTFKTSNGIALKNSVVTLTINGAKTTLRTDNKGIFTYEYKTKTAGTNNVTVSYAGNSKYNPTNTTTTFKVTPKTTKITINKINQTKLSNTATITGTFKTSNGIALKTSTVAITINGIKTTVKTDNNGIYTYNYKTTTIGTNNVTVSYGGNSRYASTSTSTTFKVVNK